MPYQLNAAGEKLVKSFEKLELVGYLRPGDVPTAGWGETGPHIKVGERYTEAQARAWFSARKKKYARIIEECLVVPANENQYAAMFALCYNIGEGWDPTKPKPKGAKEGFRQSTVLKLHNQDDPIGASRAFARWNKGRNAEGELVELRGLTRRRAAEAALYMTPTAEEEAVDPQRTHAPEVEPSAPQAASGMSTLAKVATVAAPPVVMVAKETVVQVNGVWSWLTENGIDPHIASAVMAAAAVAIVGFGAYRILRLLKAHA